MADVTGTAFYKCDFDDVDLAKTILDDCELSSSFNLTQEQINKARGNANTTLPAGLSPPRHWIKANGKRSGGRDALDNKRLGYRDKRLIELYQNPN